MCVLVFSGRIKLPDVGTGFLIRLGAGSSM